jgi:filamentous hemagglutinin
MKHKNKHVRKAARENFQGFISTRPRESVSLIVLMSVGLVMGGSQAQAQTTARVPVNALPVQARDWQQRGTGATYSQAGSAATVNLTGPANILHWSSFDIGSKASVRINQDSSTARVLNKVDGGAWLNKTVIDGALNSNGQVYIYNPNGIIFGKTATVNVNSLVASSLKLDDQRFMDGVLSPSTAANFALDTLLGFVPGAVMVEGERNGTVLQQAAITAQQNGLIMLLAPQVSNAGKLSAPDGQVVLAAGSKVYLAAPQGSTMRGLRVEVSSEGLADLANTLKSESEGLGDLARSVNPSATNAAVGQMDVQRGNITMVGLAVNQMGIASATTSVNLNGSIFLKAQDGAIKSSATSAAVASQGGSLVLGEKSSTSILPTLGDTATAAAPPAGQAFKNSLVELSGQSVKLEKNAEVIAPSGKVTITARVNPNAADQIKNSSVVEFGEGSVVDVSGTTGTMLEMASNVVTAELRGGELADNALLKNSAVRGQTVRFDRRKAANGIPIANIKGYLDLLEHNVGEYTAAGGTVTVTSEGTINQKGGSKINVSGGWVDYAAGYLNTSKLVLGNRLFDIETAPSNLAYNKVVNLANSPRNWETGYREGKSAGTIQFNAPSITMQGELQGHVTLGERQRDMGASNRPLGGQLQIGNISDATMDTTTGRTSFGALDQFGFTGNLVIGAPATGNDLSLNVNALASSGFSRISAITTGNVTVAAPVSMSAGGQLRLGAGGDLNWNGNLTLPGGSVTASALNHLNVKDGVTFDLAGTWQNDTVVANLSRDANGKWRYKLPTAPVAPKGGSVRLYANQLNVGNRVGMDVSGGAWLDIGGNLTAGDAGSITLQATPLSNSLDGKLRLGNDLNLSGYALVDTVLKNLPKGGSVTLVGRNAVLGGDAAMEDATTEAGDLFLSEDFFSKGGFTTQTVRANGNLSVTAGTVITPRADAWVLNPLSPRLASGTMGSAATHKTLPLTGPTGARQAASLTLSATGRSVPGDGLGVLRVGKDAAILVDSGASVTLSADQQMTVDGTVKAEGGTISLLMLTSPPDSTDNSYNSSRSIWLGSHAKLLANGSADRVVVNGIASGEVLDGGTVRIGRLGSAGMEAAVGYVVAEEGSLIDVSGAKAENLRFRYGSYLTQPKTVGSAGGIIDIRAREGMMLAGQLRGKAGTADARGGTLSVTLDREDRVGGSAFPQAPRNLMLTSQAASAVLPTGLKAGDAIVGYEGKGVVPVSTFAEGGFANLKFKSQDVLSFAGAQADGSGALAISASSSVELNAPNFVAAHAGDKRTVVQIDAPYVSLGSSDSRYQAPETALDGGATLKVSATTIDVVGNSATQGFGRVDLIAKEDIRLVGSPLDDTIGAPGSFNTGSQLTLTAAQVYPTTLSSFTLALNGADTTLRFQGNGETAQPVLSAAGSLTAKAGHIVQAGRVVAPFGSITLDASKDLTYESGSVTSVAGQGTVPFGTVVNGSDWTYELGNQTITWRVNPSADPALGERALPTKSIVSRAPSVVQKNGAVLDLSGGGTLYGYEFTPGPGGSADVLQSSGGSKNQNFAINPNYKSSVAPLDWQYGSDGLKTGDRVYLSGGNGLAAGYYTLLPAHYALLDGGYAIEATTGTRDMVPRANRVNFDGSMLLAGYRSSSTDGGGDTRWSGFTVSPQKLIGQRSEITGYDANTFFTAQAKTLGVSVPVLPMDAGRVAFDVIDRLTLDGLTRLRGAAAKGTQKAGARGTADITAPLIDVVADRSLDTGNYVKLLADDLVALGADSLLLGGTRSTQNDGTHVSVTADIVRVDNTAAHPLTGSEFILAANDTVQVTGRAVLNASAAADRTPGDLIIDGSGTKADGALLRLSGGSAVTVQRTQPAGKHGRLEVGAGATLVAGASMYLDATSAMKFDGRLKLADGAALGISAPRISLGNAISADVDGMVLDSATLAGLGSLSALSLASYSTMDWYGAVNLGRASMNQLNLSASGFQSYGSSATVSARNVLLSGGSNFELARTVPAVASGALAVNAETIRIGSGELQAKGFSTVQLNAKREVRGVGTNGVFSTDQNLTVATPRISTDGGAGASFNAAGNLNLVATTAGAAPAKAGLGGNLSFHGGTVVSNAQILASAGQVTVRGDHGVTLNGGTLDVHGESVAFGTGAAYAPAGSITLDGGDGNVVLGANAVLNLSAQGAAAGTLSVRATGSSISKAVLDGAILGGATAVADVYAGALPTQGRFALDVGQASSGAEFDALNAKLNTAGLTESRQFRVRRGDVTQGAGGLIQAHDISIAADDGSLTIAGTLDASGAKGGTVELYAAQANAQGTQGKLTLASTARINAQANQAATSEAGSIGDGGRVVLGVSNANGQAATHVQSGPSILAQAGSEINLSGLGDGGQGGTLVLRAPRVGGGAGSDVAVGQFKTTVTGSRASTVEAVKVYQASTISEKPDSATNLDASLGGKMAVEAGQFMRGQSAIASRLGRSDVQVTSGVEVRSSGDLTVSVNEQSFDKENRGWNLNTWRFGGEAGALSLRAQGNLLVSGSINDGFVKPVGPTGMPNWLLDTGSKSWSYRLVGGADLQAANPLAVQASATRGDMAVKFARAASVEDTPVALVRTGTGRIDVAAGRDVRLGTVTLPDVDGDHTLDQVFGAALYTAGRASVLKNGFTAPQNASNSLYGSAGNTSASFGTQGGGVTVAASRDVVGAQVPQLVNNWLFRQGRSGLDKNGNLVFEQVKANNKLQTLNTAWWARTDYFSQGLATFGGGDISVTAGGSVKDLSASVATNAYIPGATPTGTALHEQGGGDLAVHAGADILGGSFYVQKGKAVLHADGSIAGGKQTALDLVASARSDDSVYSALRPVLALGNASFDLSAGRNLEIETVYNPMLTRQSVNNVQSGLNPFSSFLDFDNQNTSALNYKKQYAQYSSFSTYGNNSAVRMTAVGGNVLLSNNALLVAASGGSAQPLSDYGNQLAALFGYAPAVYNAAALTGNLTSAQGFSVAPSATGQLSLLAGQSVKLSSNNILYPGIVMLDADPAAMSSPKAPTLLQQSDLNLLRGAVTGLSAHTAGMLHANDEVPVRIVAKAGSIEGQSDTVASLILPKRAEIIAGQDVRDLGFTVQHNRASDETIVQAGRNFIDSTNTASSSPVKHVVAGPGLLSLQAGRDIDLGNSQGVVTRGNLDNAYLPEGGASVVAVAGVSAAVDTQTRNPAEKLTRNESLFTDLVAAGKLNDLSTFDGLINNAFPAIGSGNINVFGSQFKTEQGGSLDLLAPGGSVVAGLVSVPSYLLGRPASETGIFTVRGGAIRSLVKTDFLVNQGRVFSLGGGDITLVSQFGNIDAGRGTKTATSAPPPLLTTDASGNTRIDISGSIAGSGIATLRTSDKQKPSNVYAVAPRGIFDAGDAGVRATGAAKIIAKIVLNATNIAASAGVSGAVAVDTGGLAAAAAPASTGNSAQDATKQLAAPPKDLLGLAVELLGFGDAEDSRSNANPNKSDAERERDKRDKANNR